MTQSPKNLMRNDRGQSLVEFALTLPMLLVVMFMITEFGRALYQYNVMAQASREGARTAVVGSNTNAETLGRERMDAFLTATGMVTTDLVREVEIIDNYNGTGTKVVRATVDMPFRWILQGDLPTNPDGTATVSPTSGAPGGLNLHAETVMRAEF
jgi:Flp pilus assembly protein TadG